MAGQNPYNAQNPYNNNQQYNLPQNFGAMNLNNQQGYQQTNYNDPNQYHQQYNQQAYPNQQQYYQQPNQQPYNQPQAHNYQPQPQNYQPQHQNYPREYQQQQQYTPQNYYQQNYYPPNPQQYTPNYPPNQQVPTNPQFPQQYTPNYPPNQQVPLSNSGYISQNLEEGHIYAQQNTEPVNIIQPLTALKTDEARTEENLVGYVLATFNQALQSNFSIDKIGFENRVSLLDGYPPEYTLESILEEMNRGCSVVLHQSGKKPKTLSLHLVGPDNNKFIIGKRTIFLRQVSELRLGQKTTSFSKRSSADDEKYSFSVVLSSKNIKSTKNSADLVFLKTTEFEVWVDGLSHLIPIFRKESADTAFLRYKWDLFFSSKSANSGSILDDEGNPTINLKGLRILLKQLYLKISENELQRKFQEVDDNGDGVLQFEEFLVLFNKLRSRNEIFEIFQKYSNQNGIISKEKFFEFLLQEQGDYFITEKNCTQIMNHFGPSGITFPVFEEFMVSPLNGAIHPKNKYLITQDMSHPLSDYFINSSHNTYLEGDQLKGKSTVEIYIKVLKSGCRCIELDLWDGDDGKPIITHGHTLCSNIKAEDVIKAISQYAFWSTDFPLILSLENHCSLPQQRLQAQWFVQYFGDLLCTQKEFLEYQNLYKGYLPSPNQLKRKIILKGKGLSKEDEKSDEDDIIETRDVAKELIDITCLPTFKYSDLRTASNYDNKFMASFVETKISKLSETNPRELVEYNTKKLSRVYPKGSRVDSSNYDPTWCWIMGCQLVALNFQTTNTFPMWINQGKFSDNGNSGYLLKPKSMHSKEVSGYQSYFDFYNPLQNESTYSKLTIKIISCRLLPKISKTQLNPHIISAVKGVPFDTTQDGFKSTTQNNGFNPYWGETFQFPLQCSQLANLVLTVYNGKSAIAYFSSRVDALRNGHRIMPLRDVKNAELIPLCNLFVHISLQ